MAVVEFLCWLSNRIIIVYMGVRINLSDGIIKSLKSNVIVYLVHFLVFIEEVLVLSSFENAEVSWLSSLNIVCH